MQSLSTILPGYRASPSQPPIKTYSAEELDTRGASLALDFNRKIKEVLQDILVITSTGIGHIPVLHQAITWRGFEPFLVLAQPRDFSNSPLNHDWKPIVPNPHPTILIGDIHGREYPVNLPEGQKLKDSGIKTVHFLYEELLDDTDNPHKTQLGIKLKFGNFAGRIGGNPVYMQILDTLDAYKDIGLVVKHDLLDGRLIQSNKTFFI